MKTMSTFLLITIMLSFSCNVLLAQNAVFQFPQHFDDNHFVSGDEDDQIGRTGVGSCTMNGESMYVMVFSGDMQGFGWHYDDQTGYQELVTNESISHPDVVVYYYVDENQILAFFTYEMSAYIYFEIWEYLEATNEWIIYHDAEMLGQGKQPNVDRGPYKDLAVVWGDQDEEQIWGATGTITGYIYSIEVVNECPFGNNVLNPDVAINYYDGQQYILMVYKVVDHQNSEEIITVRRYEYNNFYYNAQGFIAPGNPDFSSVDIGYYGSPRIAAPHKNSQHENACQVVVVEQTPSGKYIVHGRNANSSSLCPSPGYLQPSVLNDHTCESEYGIIYDPQDYETVGPVVSFYEDIHVAWSYKSPETNNFVILYRRLHIEDCDRGKVRQTNVNAPYYSYSLVNGRNQSWGIGDQYLPCIDSRYSLENEKFIGWFNSNGNDPRPEYKITNTNVLIFWSFC